MLNEQEMDEMRYLEAYMKLPEVEQKRRMLEMYQNMTEEERQKTLADEYRKRVDEVERHKREADGCRRDLLRAQGAKEEMCQELEQMKRELELISKGLSNKEVREELQNDREFQQQYQRKVRVYQAECEVSQKGNRHEEALKNYQDIEEALQKAQEKCMAAIEAYFKAESEEDKKKALGRYATQEVILMGLSLEDYKRREECRVSLKELKEAGNSLPGEE